MSLRQIQTRSFLEFIVGSYLASGKKPSDTEVFKALNYYFAQQPAGSPIKLTTDLFRRDPKSNVDDFNDFVASLYVNLSYLFQQVDEHIDQNILLTTALMSQMKTVRMKRQKMERKVDDILLGLYNTDGYFSSVSDGFFDTSLVDFNYTTAFIDVDSNTVSIPANATLTRNIDLTGTNTPPVSVFQRRDITKTIPFVQQTDFSQAVDGLSNTAWYITSRIQEPSDGIMVRLNLDLNLGLSDVNPTQIVLTPHGVTETQCSIQKTVLSSTQLTEQLPFSNSIKTSADRMTFINEDSSMSVDGLIFEFTKGVPDYYENNQDGTKTGVYIIGIKELIVTEQAYDNMATLVSQPLDVNSGDGNVIDAISMTVQDSKPLNTTLRYYVAPDNEEATQLSDFQWQEITPIDHAVRGDKSRTVVNLGGARRSQFEYRSQPRKTTDAELIQINTSTNDVSIKNPTNAYFDFDVYRIGRFEDDFLPNSISLEEGINTTKIYHTALHEDNILNTFLFWKEKFEDPTSYISTVGAIDTGNEFFYGVDIGENNRSVYVETFIYADDDLPIALREITKSNPSSKTWDVKVYLNGREIAAMPVGIDRVTAPLKINRGKNSIVLAANIPTPSSVNFVPYIGSVAFDILSFGTVKLSDMVYVDLYKFRDSGYRDETNTSPNKWFTIYNNELVTRSKISDNYRIRFNSKTDDAPEAIRLRAELTRSEQNNKVSPLIDSYRIRFAYNQGSNS